MSKELFEHVQKLSDEEILRIIVDLMEVDESIFHPVKAGEKVEESQDIKKEESKP